MANPGDTKEFENFLLEGSYEKPVISYFAPGSLKAGAQDLRTCIRAVDYSGNELTIHILSCKSTSDILLESIEGDYKYVFANAGIYTVEVMAMDSGRRKTVCSIQIPVQNE